MIRPLVMIALCSVLFGCSARTEDLFGTWQSKASGTTQRTIILRSNLSFQATGIPSSIACLNSPDSEPVDGEGTWEYQEDQDRVFLVFQTYSRKECERPYGVMLIRLSPKQLVASESVDNPAGSLVFSLSDGSN